MYKIRGADQKEYGPVSAEQMRQWIAEGRANAHTLVQGPDSTEWKPLSAFTEFAAVLPPPPPPTPAPGTFAGPGGIQPAVPNYLWQSIVCTACCCLPFGIPAIIFASQVNGKLAMGDVAGAMEASRKAKMWCWVSFGAGILAGIVWGTLQAVALAASGFGQ
jgi:hypothetical protein